MENRVLNFQLNVQDVNVILQSLGKQPLESVLTTFLSVRDQADKQLQPTSSNPVIKG